MTNYTKRIAEEALSRCLFEFIEPSIETQNFKVPLIFVEQVINIMRENLLVHDSNETDYSWWVDHEGFWKIRKGKSLFVVAEGPKHSLLEGRKLFDILMKEGQHD